jgi:hypothetical protein
MIGHCEIALKRPLDRFDRNDVSAEVAKNLAPRLVPYAPLARCLRKHVV